MGRDADAPRAVALWLAVVVVAAMRSTPADAQATMPGYFRQPALWNETLVFTAEGDLWRVPIAGGVPERLTSHPGQETNAVISADGKSVVFSGTYEGPRELYLLPLAGGAPRRLTWIAGLAVPVGWMSDGRLLYTTDRSSTLPNDQLFALDTITLARTAVPLWQASDGAYADDGTLFFTRLPFQGSHTRRYQGGTAQKIWKFAPGAAEAVLVTGEYSGTSKTPMIWQNRVYFLSDRDGTMNLWSMALDGSDARQLTRHDDFDAQSPTLSAGRIAYQHGADIRLYDIASGSDRLVPITLVSDFDQMRERWITSPLDWITSAHLSPEGDRVVLTARGQVFVAPARQGRLVQVTRNKQVRYRNGRFMPDGKSLIALADQTGELEFWSMPPNGIGETSQLTTGATVLRWDGLPSPDGARLAHHDKNQQLWIFDLKKKTETKIADNLEGGFDDLAWSPDSRFLAYTTPDVNTLTRIHLWDSTSGKSTPVTSDRYDSYSPAWSPDGQWLYFLSDRHFESLVKSPWGSREPEPFYDKQTKAYHVGLKPGQRSPFDPDDELNPPKPDSKDAKDEKKADAGKDDDKKATDTKTADKKSSDATKNQKDATKPAVKPIDADLTGIETRLREVPLPPGNYSALSMDDKRLYFLSRDADPGSKLTLKVFPLDNKQPELATFQDDVKSYEMSADRKKLLIRREKDFYVVDGGEKAPAELTKSKVPLADWKVRLDVRDEWRQMFTEAWRLERDYFYDRAMHGVDWKAVKDKYAPLVDRVTDRNELADVLAQMVSELSALHVFVFGGDVRKGSDDVWPATLGAQLDRDERAGGYRIARIYKSDPDRPPRLSPLARPGADVKEGDVITQVNGDPVLGVPDIGQLLRAQAGQQVLLQVKPASGAARNVVVFPIDREADAELRYDDWEYTRRLEVDRASQNRIGYLHLRAMGSDDIEQWTREYYPVFNRDGLIIDVRHNRGGNIDSWLLGRLLRKAWFYWQPRVGRPYWNMQYAFRGHVVVLVDEFTASDGEAFAEGFRRLGLGKIIGTRTWGGEIWLTASNVLVDRGIATAAEFGVYGPEGAWLIEGHGVDPDIVVDNAPRATFDGKDAQLEAAIAHLQEMIRTKPVPVPPAPPYPIKRFVPPARPAAQ